MSDGYWFQQRYDALMLNEHENGHPESDPSKCPYDHADENGDSE